MSLADLQSWLLQEGVRDDLDAITRLTVRNELDNLAPDPSAPSATAIDWPRLLLAGSILARSDQRRDQEAALRIATAAISLTDGQALKDAGAVLLGKLSNFRAIALATNRGLLTADLDGRLGVALRLEAQRREMDRSILVQSSGAWLQVNDFQQRFWSNAGGERWLSASAPTASGKTFLVLQWLIDQVIAREARVAVYLAPTRALVSEIETSLKRLLGNTEEIEVSSLPLPDKYRAARAGGARVILVFTQERLHFLANVLSDVLSIDLLIVDEAHKIGDNQRGVILQDAIERATRANPKLKAVFISPATQNPEELLTDAPDGVQTVAVDSDFSTVLQNLMVATQVPRKSKLWTLTLRQEGATLPVGTLQLASTPDGLKKRLAFIAAAVGERGGTLVYTNGAGEAEEVADLISQLLPKLRPVDSELLELAELARKGVHQDFRLAPLVERGVAFHYGNMPSLLRLEIERLFRSGKIRFLVCTSTLIEGVNLSCRTIVVRGPRKGKGHPMEPHDFWNLAGRAGRWGDEFQGNIICIDPEDTQAWPSGVPSRARYPIKRESDAVLDLGDGMADYLSERGLSDISSIEDTDKFEQVGAYLLTTFMRLGSISAASLSKRHDAASIAKLDQALGALAAQIEIDVDLAARHPGVSAVGLQRLLEAFRSYGGDVENLLLAEVASNDSYDRFITIMGRINKHMFLAFAPESRIRLYALIVFKWLKGYSLAKIIRDSIEWHQNTARSFKLPDLIRGTMELVEQIARFRAPKYLSAYMDVLHLHLREIGREDLIDDGLDIGTQLEFGVSSTTLLSLMELGLSRMSAVVLYEKIARDDLNREECVAWIAERVGQLQTMDVPAIIIREVRERLTLPGDIAS
ncbi:DEAD/DEAH box helicase [Bordetella bronchiseptica]|uniref:Dead/deah box helicase n=2 Tax=Bordetella bronchiseptica TaxID=518 RepID=A0A0C6P5Q9_BORBO|nr:DEAD/DEAH box helicase [Bordetella bronchiseptica]AWP73392.1 DEAD/DEAH box helicase [Bordetella bronchiseptica]AZW10936.1 DEAD/DEAH box helicase [Bordetella bronchiseptica]AZW20197.1 DEAD/DEAH box helicase [Bordetella bronchiseptica]KCV37801.1 DEAD/DEAH box helicase [Bordetella bronchiseptica 00-P-2796]KDB96846.1 DEAD/DEAH box helicase [Bordetella bronchiseptica D993]